MKTLFFAVALVICINAYPQEASERDGTFVRVYDLEGRKFSKGKILSFSDTLLLLKGQQQVDPEKIGFIKTKRSSGNNVLIGAISLGLFSGIIGAVTAEPDDFLGFTPGEGFFLGAILGTPAGALLGWISSLFKESSTFIINGDLQKWRQFQNSRTEAPPIN